jgi:hypothetical protein
MPTAVRVFIISITAALSSVVTSAEEAVPTLGEALKEIVVSFGGARVNAALISHEAAPAGAARPPDVAVQFNHAAAARTVMKAVHVLRDQGESGQA